MASTDGANVNPDVMAAVELALSGNGEDARQRFDALWRSLPLDDHFHRCVVAHYMADLQAEATDELRWDRWALAAAFAAQRESFEDRVPGVSWSNFLPSLYLNLAASHERLGELEDARRYAAIALSRVGDAAETPLGDATRAAIQRLCARLE